jgi:hypothetical protein
MAHISNPKGAYGQPAHDSPTGQTVEEFEVGTAVAANQCVAITYSAANDKYTVAPTAATTDNFVGVALHAADAGQTVKVVTHGPVLAKVAASITSGSTTTSRHVSAGASGRITTAATTLGHTLAGLILENASGATADDLKAVYVAPSIAYAS